MRYLPVEKYPVTTSENVLVAIRNLKIWFPEEKSFLGKVKTYFKAVDDVSFDMKKGEVLGLVGESGCGKSTLGKALIGLLPVKDGQVVFENRDITQSDPK